MEAGQPNQIISMLVMIVPMVLVFYFIIIRPQKKRDKEFRSMLDTLQVGNKIITKGGIIGKIINIKDDEITVETGVARTQFVIKKYAIEKIDKPIEA